MITIIEGDGTGIGKTSLATALAIEDMTVNLSERRRICRKHIRKMNACGFDNLEVPKGHLIYADYKIESRSPGMPLRKSHDITGFEFGMPNPYFKTIFEPPAATIVLDEAITYYQSRRSGLSEFVYMKFQLKRHYGLNIILICLRNEEIDKIIRSHVNRVIYVTGHKHYFDRDGNRKKTTWHGIEFKSCFQAKKFKEGDHIGQGKKFKYTFHGDILKCYDNESNSGVHYNGREGQQFGTVALASPRKKSGTRLLEAPPGFYSLDNLKKNNEEEEE